MQPPACAGEAGDEIFVLSRIPMPAQAGICSVTALPFRAGGLCKRSNDPYDVLKPKHLDDMGREVEG